MTTIEPEMPKRGLHINGGRPRTSDRAVLDGIFWWMRSGCPWPELPAEYPSRHVCARYYREWRASGLLLKVLRALADDLEFRAGVNYRDPMLPVPDTARGRSSWIWQTVLLLRSPEALAILSEGDEDDRDEVGF
jgi:transposase